MKKFIAISILFITVFFNFCSYAYDDLDTKDFIPESTENILLENGIDDFSYKYLLDLSVDDVFKFLFSTIKKEISKPSIVIYSIFLIALVISFANGMNSGFLNKEMDSSISSVGILCFCASAFLPVFNCMQATSKFIEEISSFVRAFVPALSSVMMISGRVNGAIGYQTAIIASNEFMSYFLSKIIIPLLFIYLAISLIGHTMNGISLENISSFVKSFVMFSLTFTVTIFVSIITLKGVVGAGADTVALRTGKFFIGSFVPAVGGALADAAATFQKSIGLIKSTTGTFGIIAMVLIFVPFFIRIAMYKFACDIGAFLSGLLGADKISRMIKDLSNILGLFIAVVLSYGTIVVLSTAVTLMFGGV